MTALSFTSGVGLAAKSIFEVSFIWAGDTIVHVSTAPTRIHLEVCVEDEELRLVLDDREESFTGKRRPGSSPGVCVAVPPLRP